MHGRCAPPGAGESTGPFYLGVRQWRASRAAPAHGRTQFLALQCEVLEVRRSLEAEANRCKQDHCNFQAWLAGDFNFPVAGEAPTFVQDPTGIHAPPQDAPRNSSESPTRWESLLGGMTELATDGPTHITAHTGRLQRLDRIYCFQPGWAITKQKVAVRVVLSPAVVPARALSDHAPVCASI